MNKNDTTSTAAVIVGGGAGTRLGAGTPKAFVPLAGKPLFVHSLETFEQHPAISPVILVVPEDGVATARRILAGRQARTETVVVAGGAERWQSVQCGVMAAGESCAWVLIHDAARPFVTAGVIDSLLSKRDAWQSIITATPLDDTIRRIEHDRCVATLDRSVLIRVGTPQLFHRVTLCEAFAHAPAMQPPPTDEAMLMEQCGIVTGFSWGDPLNFKITTPKDFELAEAILSQRSG